MSISASSESRWRIDRAPSVVIDGGRISSPSASSRSRAYSSRRSAIASVRSLVRRVHPGRVPQASVGRTSETPASGPLAGPSAGGSFAAARSPGRVDLRRPTAVSSGRRPYSRRRARDPPSGRRAGAGRLDLGGVPRPERQCMRGQNQIPVTSRLQRRIARSLLVWGSVSPGVSCTPRRRRGPVRRRSG